MNWKRNLLGWTIVTCCTVSQASPYVILGEGYDTQKQAIRGQCVELDVADGQDRNELVISRGEQDSRLRVDSEIQFKDLKQMLNIEAGGELSLEVITASAKTEFLVDTATTEYTQTFRFAVDAVGPSIRPLRTRLSAKGQEYAARGKNAVTYENCGDSWVSQIDLGAKLIINLNFRFKNLKFKSEFNADAEVDFIDLLSASSSMDVVFDRYSEKMSVSISAYQLGGDPTQLPAVLSRSDSDSNLAFINCSISNREACRSAVSQLAAYASDSQDGFRGQFKLDQGQVNPLTLSGYAVMGFKTKKYNQSGYDGLFFEASQVVDREIARQRQQVLEDYLDQVMFVERANLLLGTDLTDEDRSKYVDLQKKIEANINTLKDMAQVCFESPKMCLGHIEANQSKLSPIAESDFQRTLRFYDYCMVPELEPERKPTTDAIIEEVKRASGIQPDEVVSCEILKRNLTSLVELDLRDKNIRYLDPLRDLKNLRVLRLSKNRIFDIDALKTLDGLEELDLRHNYIQSLEPLAELSHLRRLDVAFNKIRYIDPLENLELDDLRIHGNHLPARLSSTQMAGFFGLQLGESIFIHNRDACHAERKKLYSSSRLTKDQYQLWESMNMIPNYQPVDGQIPGEILSWKHCDAAAMYLPY